MFITKEIPLSNGRTAEDSYFTCDTCGTSLDYTAVHVRISGIELKIHKDYCRGCVPQGLREYING